MISAGLHSFLTGDDAECLADGWQHRAGDPFLEPVRQAPRLDRIPATKDQGMEAALGYDREFLGATRGI